MIIDLVNIKFDIPLILEKITALTQPLPFNPWPAGGLFTPGERFQKENIQLRGVFCWRLYTVYAKSQAGGFSQPHESNIAVKLDHLPKSG